MDNLDHNFAFWYANRGMVSLGIAEMLRVLPKNNSSYNILLKTFQEQMTIENRPIIRPLTGLPYMVISDLGAGISAHGIFDVGMWIYAVSEGIKQGWLNREEYDTVLRDYWREIDRNFKAELPSPNEPYHIVYRPYLEWAGVMFAATGIKGLDEDLKYKRPLIVKEETFAKMNDDVIISQWSSLRSAIIKGDKSIVTDINNQYRNSKYGKEQILTRKHNNIGQTLIAMELFRINNKPDVQMGVNIILDKILDDKIECNNKLLPALVMAEAFNTYGSIKYKEKAIELWQNNDCKPQWLLSVAMGKEINVDNSANIAGIKELANAISAKFAKQKEMQSKIDEREFANIAKSLLADGQEKELSIALAKRDIVEIKNPSSELKKLQLMMALSIVNPTGDDKQLALIQEFLSSTPKMTSENMLIIGFVYSRAIKLLKDAKFADAGYELMKIYCQKLQTPDGLFSPAEHANSTSRSSGEAALGLSLFLKEFPKDHHGYHYLKWSYEKLSKILERTQDANGLWHIIPDNWNTLIDSGATAMFSASLAIGLKEIWIEQIEYRDMLKLAIKVLKKKLDSKSRLTNCIAKFKTLNENDASNIAQAVSISRETLAMTSLILALNEVDNYWKSPQADAPENMARALGSLFDFNARSYTEKLPDGRFLQHFSAGGNVEVSRYKSLAGERSLAKAVKYTEEESLRRVPYHPWWDGKGVPKSLQKQPFPCGGISVWLKDNPSVHMVTSDAGYWTMPMPYCVLNQKFEEDIIVCIQARGEKVFEVKFKQEKNETFPSRLNASHLALCDLCTGIYSATEISNLPTGPADFVNDYLLAERLLELRRKERAKLLELLKSQPKPQLLQDNKILTPVYLRGKVISALDGTPVKQVSVWLHRNPSIIARAKTSGEFEIMYDDAVLYDQETDSLMITASGYKPLEILLDSYLKDNISITMQPCSMQLEIVGNGAVPMIRIPKGFFRMGKGRFWHINSYLRTDEFCGNSWPIKTTYMPSFYYGQYPLYKDRKDELVKWANNNGYEIKFWRFPQICNALSERDGLTPCYYTSDLRVIRKMEDLTEAMVCNWRADGYRLPTFAERTYACRAGNTSSMFWGVGYAGKQLDQIPTTQSRMREFGGHTSFGGGGGDPGNSYRVRPACRLPLDWGVYDNYYGMGAVDRLWDHVYWLAEERFNPRGPTLKQRYAINRINFGPGGSDLMRMTPYGLDWLEIVFYDDWDANPTGLFCYDWGQKHDDLSWCGTLNDSMWIPNRFVRSAENICNDVSLLKKVEDSTLNLPKPIKTKTINEKITMVDIPKGQTVVGNQTPMGVHRAAPKIWRVPPCPAHTVQVDAFSMANFETTVAQWRNVRNWAIKNGYTDLVEGSFGKSSSHDLRHPVIGVNWYDVVKWCNALSEMKNCKPCYTVNGKIYKVGQEDNVDCDWEINGYRLPTESEWEYAAGGGNEANYYWGAYSSKQHCWMKSTAQPEYSARNMSHPVGEKIGNQYGLYDIIGNVDEWCWDWVGPYNMRKTNSVVINPHGPKNFDNITTHLASMNKIESKELEKTGSLWGKIKKGWNKKSQGRSVRGGNYTSKIMRQHLGMLGDWERGVDKPSSAKEIVGFRVVIGNKK